MADTLKKEETSFAAKQANPIIDHFVKEHLPGIASMVDARVDEVRRQATKLVEDSMAEVRRLLGGRTVPEVLDGVEHKLAADIDRILTERVGQMRKETESLVGVAKRDFLGDQDVPRIAASLEKAIAADIDRILADRIGQVQVEAKTLITYALHEAHKELAVLIERDINLTVQMLRQEAEVLVSHSLDRVSSEAQSLVKELSKAISDQRIEVKADLTDVAVTARKEMTRVLPWVAVIAGLMNIAGILIAWFFSKAG